MNIILNLIITIQKIIIRKHLMAQQEVKQFAEKGKVVAAVAGAVAGAVAKQPPNI